ncbi:MAG: DUF4296 domain-containing protein [Flavisolibacter sp.]
MKQRLAFLLIICFCACKSSVPSDVLPPKKMQAVLWDIMQADELADYYSTSDSSFKALSKHIVYYRKVFAIHQISKDAFTRSLKYYQEHPASLKPILDSLQRHQQILQEKDSVSRQHIGPIVRDSLKRKLLVRPHPL